MRPLVGIHICLTMWLAAATPQGAAAQEGRAPYCADLDRIAGLAATTAKFSAITGEAREGDFSDTTVPLTGWADCSVYGPRTYTCDSATFKTPEETEQAIERTALQIAACPTSAWRRRQPLSSPSYVVLSNSTAPVSITLSTAQTDNHEFLVRLILFARRE
jgi:hypothetical protein